MIPGIIESGFHWQWLCIFIAVVFDGEKSGRNGTFVAHEKGLGKVKPVNLIEGSPQ